MIAPRLELPERAGLDSPVAIRLHAQRNLVLEQSLRDQTGYIR